MDKEELIISQNKINRIWNELWKKEGELNSANIFKHRLFIEGSKKFIENFPSNPTKILEVGSGSGRYSLYFAKKFPQATIIATDITPQSVKYISSLINSLGLVNCVAKESNGESLLFDDSYFDLVFCDVVIQHIVDPKPMILEMKRVLKPGGVIILSVVNTWNFHTLYKLIISLINRPYLYGYEKSYSRRQLRELFSKCGLTVIKVDGFYPAYGIYRLKYINYSFAIIGKILNRLTKYLDKITGGWVSKLFGFEIFIVASK